MSKNKKEDLAKKPDNPEKGVVIDPEVCDCGVYSYKELEKITDDLKNYVKGRKKYVPEKELEINKFKVKKILINKETTELPNQNFNSIGYITHLL